MAEQRLNAKMEAFCRLVARGETQAAAYREAGYKPSTPQGARSQASTLANRPLIKKRIAELKPPPKKPVVADGDSKEGVLEMLMDNYRLAIHKTNLPGANRAAELLGKELGMFADKLQLENLDKHLEGMSRDELRMAMAQSCSEIGMRVVDMTDEMTVDYILRNAERVGLRCEWLPGHEPTPAPAPAESDTPKLH